MQDNGIAYQDKSGGKYPAGVFSQLVQERLFSVWLFYHCVKE